MYEEEEGPKFKFKRGENIKDHFSVSNKKKISHLIETDDDYEKVGNSSQEESEEPDLKFSFSQEDKPKKVKPRKKAAEESIFFSSGSPRKTLVKNRKSIVM